MDILLAQILFRNNDLMASGAFVLSFALTVLTNLTSIDLR
jgi:hypothetical protein